jgi:hypothetical protein
MKAFYTSYLRILRLKNLLRAVTYCLNFYSRRMSLFLRTQKVITSRYVGLLNINFKRASWTRPKGISSAKISLKKIKITI